MAWTTPMTAVEREVFTSPQWNSHVRDNSLETMAGKATTAGRYFVSTGANAIVERSMGNVTVATSQTRADVTYGDLATAGPATTVTTGSEALVWITCEMSSDAAADSPEISTQKIYTATGSATYQADGTNRSDGSRMYQGYFDSTNGNQYSMALLPYATMVTDLADSTIDSCEIFLDNDHFYSNGGGYAIIGTHNQTSLSGSHVYSQVTSDLSRAFYNKGQAKYVYVAEEIAEMFRDGTAKGLALGKGPTSSLSYYGFFKGGTSPKIRIAYTKAGTVGGYCKASFAVSGASTIAVSDDWAMYASGQTASNSNRWTTCHRVTGLTPGSNTFTMKYAAGASGSTGTFARRNIIVLPL